MADPKVDAKVASINFLDAIKYARFIPLVIQIVSSVQVVMGPGEPEAKEGAALKALAGLLALTEGVTEKDLLNDEAFLNLGRRLIALAVQLMKLQPEIEKVAADVRALKPKPVV